MKKTTLAQIKKYFGEHKRGVAPQKKKTKNPSSGTRVLLRHKESDQAHFVLGCKAFNIFDSRRYALQVLTDVLGGGMSSRLWKRVREELGAAYYVGADADFLLDHGTFVVSAGVDKAKIDLVITKIFEELRLLRDELIPEKELQRAKDHMIGSLILGLETSDDLAGFYGGQEIMTGKTLSPEAVIDRIRKTSAEDVRRVARTVIAEKAMRLAVIGPYHDKQRFKKLLHF